MRVAFLGLEALTFNDYVDVDTGRTLRAEPGQSYDIAPASGRPVPDFPAPWFVAIEWEPQFEPEPAQEPEPEVNSKPEPDPAAEPQDVPDSGDEPEPVQF